MVPIGLGVVPGWVKSLPFVSDLRFRYGGEL